MSVFFDGVASYAVVPHLRTALEPDAQQPELYIHGLYGRRHDCSGVFWASVRYGRALPNDPNIPDALDRRCDIVGFCARYCRAGTWPIHYWFCQRTAYDGRSDG